MRNPWVKKNPFLSMWMSGMNTVLGAARGHASAAARRQSTAFTSLLMPRTRRSKRSR
jgi:hypothetical protein